MANSDDSSTTQPWSKRALLHGWFVVVPFAVVVLHVMPQITHQGSIGWGLALMLGVGSFALNSTLRATVASRLPDPKTSWTYVARLLALVLMGGVVGAIVASVVRSPGPQLPLTLAIVIGLLGALPTRVRRRF